MVDQPAWTFTFKLLRPVVEAMVAEIVEQRFQGHAFIAR